MEKARVVLSCEVGGCARTYGCQDEDGKDKRLCPDEYPDKTCEGFCPADLVGRKATIYRRSGKCRCCGG